MTFHWADWVGLLGSAMFIIGFAYANVSQAMDKVAFNTLNIVGAVLLLISLSQHFNLAAVVLEAVWALIAFADHDIYTFYDWCGRLYPSIGALDDQQYGGLIVWIPSAMMSVIALILVINFLRQAEESKWS